MQNSHVGPRQSHQETWYRFDWDDVWEARDDIPLVKKRKAADMEDNAGGKAKSGEPLWTLTVTPPGDEPVIDKTEQCFIERFLTPKAHGQRTADPRKANEVQQRDSSDLLIPSPRRLLKSPMAAMAPVGSPSRNAALGTSVDHVAGSVSSPLPATASNKNRVKRLDQVFDYFDSFLNEILLTDEDNEVVAADPCRRTLQELAAHLSQSTHSSAFSGVAAPETALLGLRKAVQDRLPNVKVGLRSRDVKPSSIVEKHLQ